MPPATAAASTAAAAAPSTSVIDSAPPARKPSTAEKKYKCQFCNRAFSRSEHRSRHERSHTKERPFKCNKCRSTFVRRDLLLRHDRTVHAKDGGAQPLPSDTKRRSGPKTASAAANNKEASSNKQSQSASLDPVAQHLAPAVAAVAAAGMPAGTIVPPVIDHMDTSIDPMDDEAAAMLMTDFTHKAMASQEHEHHADNDMSAISPHTTNFLNPSNAYDNGAVSLPQMPWDTLMPQTVSDQKANSISSGPANSHDGHMPFSAAALGGSYVNSLPPILDQPGPSSDGLPNLNGPPSLSGLGTPSALSPFPSMMGPVSPVDYRRSPGPNQPLHTVRAPQVHAEEQCARILENIKRCDSEIALLETFRLPNRTVLNRYLSTYFNLFHHHLPFLHPLSFNPTEAPAPLLLAVLSIGALYTFEQDQAYMLHIGSRVLVSQFLQKKDNFSSRKSPLWAMQATLLNSIFTSWSDDPKGLEWACSIKGLLANMVSGNRYELKLRSEAREGNMPSHAEWVEDEGCRRSYFSVYVFFAMLTMTFNHSPAITFNDLDSLELPSSESMWALEVTDEESWRETLSSTPVISFREAHDRLFQGETARYSAFGARIMMSALFLEVWYHKKSSEALQDVVTEYKLRQSLEWWEKSLELCLPETVVVQLSAPHKGHPLIFNAMALFRNTKARLHVDLKQIQEALRYYDSFEVAAAMTNARDKVKRSAEMNRVIEECFNCIEVAANQGIRWVARTAATNWSVEHPLCGLDLMVILSLWLWRIEHDEEPATEEETAMYNRVRTLFDDDSADTFGQKLSGTVARLWGNMVDEVVVWGITKLIGESFKLHSQALMGYETSMEEVQRDADGSLNSRPVEALEMQTAY